jgi:hypothetical protein
MKRWLTHALLLAALFGHLGHSYYHNHVQLPHSMAQHDHHGHTSSHDHYHHTDTAEDAYEYCPLSIVEDHLVAFDHRVNTDCPETQRNIQQRAKRIAFYQAVGLYDTRAPPSA